MFVCVKGKKCTIVLPLAALCVAGGTTIFKMRLTDTGGRVKTVVLEWTKTKVWEFEFTEGVEDPNNSKVKLNEGRYDFELFSFDVTDTKQFEDVLKVVIE